MKIVVVRSAAGASAMEKPGVAADLNPPREFAVLFRSAYDRYSAVVKATGFKAED